MTAFIRHLTPKLVAAAALAALLGGQALAADLYAPRASIKDEGPYEPRFSWTGFYLGLNAGGAWGRYQVR